MGVIGIKDQNFLKKTDIKPPAKTVVGVSVPRKEVNSKRQIKTYIF